MKKNILLVLVLFTGNIIVAQIANRIYNKIAEQAKATPNEFYSKDFKWRITLPADFVKKTPTAQNGMPAGQLVSFEDKEKNSLLLTPQDFDEALDGNFAEAIKADNAAWPERLRATGTLTQIDTLNTTEVFGKHTFYVTKLIMTYPDQIVVTTYMYRSLFGKKLFYVDITYRDPKKGEQLLKAFKKSTFE